jgi:hypothetical protein
VKMNKWRPSKLQALWGGTVVIALVAGIGTGSWVLASSGLTSITVLTVILIARRRRESSRAREQRQRT